MRPSQNPPLPARIRPPFQQLNATFPESIPPPLSTTIILCNAPRIYTFLSEYTPPPPPPTHTFSTFIYDPPWIYSSVLYPLFNNYIIIRRFQNISLPPIIYPPPSATICDTPRNYPSFRENPPFLTTIFPPFLPEYIPIHLSTTICNIPRIDPSVTEYAPFSRHYM